MAEPFPHLSRAPIQEAIVDIRVRLPDASCELLLESFRPEAAVDFPTENELLSMRVDVAFSAEGEAAPGASKQSRTGSLFWNRERTRGLQARVNGFGLSHVGAYAGWSALRGDALRWWEHYRHAFQVTEVTQCSVRFVNWIDIPVATELSTLLLTRVEVGPLLPQTLDESFFRVVLPFGDSRHAAITQATAPPDQRTSPDSWPLLLDIDVRSGNTFHPDDPALWTELDALRDIKNRCFFQSLHPELVKGFA